MNSDPSSQDNADSRLDPAGEMSFVAHLIEVRDRLVKVLAVVLVLLLGLLPFSNDLYLLLAEPLLRHMPAGTSMIATEVASPFLTPFKLALVTALFLAMPAFLYHLWAFVAPGLYKNEQKLVYPLLVASSLLFYLGIAFAYYVVFPLMFGFFSATAPEGVAIMTDISKYLDFVLKIFFAFGVAFEVPIVTILLVWAGFTTPKALGQKRPYVVVGAFVFGMLLTPPDAISQTLLAIPMWILFELGLLFAKLYVRRDADESDDDDDEDIARSP
jgi:sec-independent protein translocase protein TatC